MNPKILAVGVFVVIYALIASGRIERTILSIWGAILFFIIPVATNGGISLGLLTQSDLLEYVNWEALGLIFGMFTLVSILRESGFFRFLGLSVLKFAKFNPLWIFILFSVTAAVLSALMSSITVMLFMSVLTLETAAFLKISPVPFLIAEITSANIGGSATMVGDPPNIIIGTGCNFSFMDFMSNTAPIALVALLVNMFFFYRYYRKFLSEKKTDMDKISDSDFIVPSSAIIDRRLMRNTLVFFIFTVVMLTFHHIFNISVALIGILGASLALLFEGKKALEIMEKIDWSTLIFFACLFIMVGGLEKSGVLADFANFLGRLSRGHPVFTIFIILWASAFISSLVDNVPLAALMVPVIKNISSVYGFPLGPMAWTLALGTDIGGNGTPIGASANVIGLAAAEKGGVKVTWLQYCKVAFPSMIITLLFCMIAIYLKYLM